MAAPICELRYSLSRFLPRLKLKRPVEHTVDDSTKCQILPIPHDIETRLIEVHSAATGSGIKHEISHNVAREEITEQQSPLTFPNFGFNRKPTNRFHQIFTNSISKYLLLGSNPGVPTVEITSRPRVVDNKYCAFIGFCVLDWAVPRATKII